jgi:hypothetical protein
MGKPPNKKDTQVSPIQALPKMLDSYTVVSLPVLEFSTLEASNVSSNIYLTTPCSTLTS